MSSATAYQAPFLPASPLEIVEVSPRDGLQNEALLWSTAQKIALIEHAIQAGVKRIEVASFVHPKLVPQMADAEAVVAGLKDHADINYIGLVLNERGLERALRTHDAVKTGNQVRAIDEIGTVVSASDGFGTRNQGQTSDQSVQMAKDLIRQAKAAGLRAQVTISVAFGCPFDGEIAPERVLDIIRALIEADPLEIALADTIGVGDPYRVATLVAQAKHLAPMPIRAHFHNTRGTGLANAWAAFQAGAQVLDSSIGGLGGCPFAPKATGNIASEDLVYMLKRAGIETGLALDPLLRAADYIKDILARPLASGLSRAGDFPAPKTAFPRAEPAK